MGRYVNSRSNRIDQHGGQGLKSRPSDYNHYTISTELQCIIHPKIPAVIKCKVTGNNGTTIISLKSCT